MKLKYINKKDLLLLYRAIKYIKPYLAKFVLSFICILSSIGFELIQPLIWADMLVNLFDKNFDGVLRNILYMSIFYIVETTVGFLQSYLFANLNQNIIYDLKTDMFKKVLSLPAKAFDKMRVGDFVSRIHGDSNAIAGILTNQITNTIVAFIKVIVIGFAVFKVSVPLGLVSIVTLPVSIYLFSYYGHKSRQINNTKAKIYDDYFSNIQQNMAGIREVKVLGIRNRQFNKFVQLAEQIKNKEIFGNIINNISGTLSKTVGFISQIGVYALGGFFIYKGSLSVQEFIAFTAYSAQFNFSLINITKVNSDIQQVLTSLERIFSLMDNLSFSDETFGCNHINKIEGNVEFNKVHFKYIEDIPTLDDISFKINKNSKTAIVGESGGGKTTIFNLLLKLYDTTKGEILIDGININCIDEESLREHISVVRQDPFLFNISIKDNLTLACPDKTDIEIYDACKKANIYNFIMNLPNGFSSIIGENGVNLSGGQKQRIAIARALLKNSKIILFDEATSSLDNESQFGIKSAIDHIAKTHTIVIIAHRLSTVIEADNILVVDKGKIVGQGTHDLLINKNQYYKRLYDAELRLLKDNDRSVV